MTPTEYTAAISRLSLTHTEAARLFGYQARSSERWAAGTMRVPPAVERLVWFVERRQDVRDVLDDWGKRE